jgi:hypothetical protein
MRSVRIILKVLACVVLLAVTAAIVVSVGLPERFDARRPPTTRPG